MLFRHLPQPKLPTLTREQLEDGKRWYITPEGNKYASITTILGHEEKPWLNEWRESMGIDKAAIETARCAERGTNIHSLIEKYLNNVPNHTTGFKQEYIKGFNQIKPQLNLINNIRAQEVGLYSDTLEVAGTVDCVGEFDGKLAIIDFKTSNRYKDTDMIKDYFLQVTAYALMWYERTGEPINDIVIMMTVEKGIVPLVFKDTIHKYVDILDKRIVEYIKGTK